MKAANCLDGRSPILNWRLILAALVIAALGLAPTQAAENAGPAELAGPVSKAAVAGQTCGIRVALYKGQGTGGKGPPNIIRQLQEKKTATVTQLSPADIGAGVLTNYDVIIFAGGSGSKQAEAIGEQGREAIRKFVADGGGYIGICAGAYLASSGFPWSLHLINARTVSSKWKRGRGDVKMELTAKGSGIVGGRPGHFDVHYANGPIVEPAKEKVLPPYEVLAFFRTEKAENDSPAGKMINSPAIFVGPYGQGRVACISPHPEQTPGLESYVPSIVDWVAAPKLKLANPKLTATAAH